MKSTNLATLILLIGASFSVSAQDGEYVAMVSDITGQDAITVSGQSETAEILDELLSGKELSLADGSSLTLFFFASSEEYTYEGPAQILIEEQQPKLLSGSEANTRNLDMAKLVGIASEDEGGIDLGVLKLRAFEKPVLELLGPVDTMVVAKYPRFSWSPVEGASSYEFILSNELGKRIADISVRDTWVVLPEDATLVAGAEYTWEIITQTTDQTEYRAHAYFNVAEEYLRVEVDSSRPADDASFSEKVVYARLLEKLDLKHDAKALWQELATLKPSSALLKARTESNTDK